MQWRFDRRETIQIAKAWIDLLLQRLAVKIKTPVLEVHIPIEIRRSLVLLAISMLAVGCEPKDVRPGFWLGGEDVSSRVEDWQFTDQIDEVFIQTRSWYDIPHSTTIWCAHVADELYIGSYGEDKKLWEINVLRDNRARIRISGKIYDVTVTKLDDATQRHVVGMAYQRKYDMAQIFGDEIPRWSFYRVEQDANEKPST